MCSLGSIATEGSPRIWTEETPSSQMRFTMWVLPKKSHAAAAGEVNGEGAGEVVEEIAVGNED